MLNRINSICIEGAMGVGKSTLAKIVAEKFGVHAIFEEYNENPFLKLFYENNYNVNYQNELFFLVQRLTQQSKFKIDHDGSQFISDYYIGKCLIFAQINLSDRQYKQFHELYQEIVQETFNPDLIVYLKRDHKEIMQQIKRRGRTYEKGMSGDYIKKLQLGYDTFFSHYTGSEIIEIDVTGKDYLKKEADLTWLLENIRSHEFTEKKFETLQFC